MKYTPLVLFCMLLLCGKAKVARAQDTAVIYRNRLHFTPLRIIGMVNSGWEAGYERMIGKRYSAKVLGAWLHSNFNQVPYYSYSGYRLGAEGKRFFAFSEQADAYVSAEAIYNNVAYSTQLFFMPGNIPGPINYTLGYDDTIEVSNHNLSLNCKVGVQCRLGRFMVDFYGGLGLKYKQVVQTGRLHPNDYAFSRHPNIYKISASEMNGITVNVPLNFTVAYCF